LKKTLSGETIFFLGLLQEEENIAKIYVELHPWEDEIWDLCASNDHFEEILYNYLK